MNIDINSWLQDELEGFVKNLLLLDWCKENNKPLRKYYVSLERQAMTTPEYGEFHYSIRKVGSKNYDNPIDKVSITIRDAMRRYVSNENQS